jgi:hypothetical protein
LYNHKQKASKETPNVSCTLRIALKCYLSLTFLSHSPFSFLGKKRGKRIRKDQEGPPSQQRLSHRKFKNKIYPFLFLSKREKKEEWASCFSDAKIADAFHAGPCELLKCPENLFFSLRNEE